MTFAEVIIKRFEGFVETHSKRNPWEIEAAEEMQKAIPVLHQHAAMAEALELQVAAETAHLKCDECEGQEIPELCPKCFPLYDDARLARMKALSAVVERGQS